MKRDHNGCTPAFYIHTESWYGKPGLGSPLDRDQIERFMIGMYNIHGGGTTGEFMLSFEQLAGEVVIRVLAYGDSISAILEMDRSAGLLGIIRDCSGAKNTPRQVAQRLIDAGFIDRTERDNPYANDVEHYLSIRETMRDTVRGLCSCGWVSTCSRSMDIADQWQQHVDKERMK